MFVPFIVMGYANSGHVEMYNETAYHVMMRNDKIYHSFLILTNLKVEDLTQKM